MNLTLIVLVKWSGRGRWCGEVPRFAANYIVQLRHTGGKKGGEGYIVMYVVHGGSNKLVSYFRTSEITTIGSRNLIIVNNSPNETTTKISSLFFWSFTLLAISGWFVQDSVGQQLAE